MFILKNNNDFFVIFKFSNTIVNKNDRYYGFLFCFDFFFSLFNIKKYFFCHRLDKEVSGIILIARNCCFLRKIKKIFFFKKFKKFYISFNFGISKTNFIINNNILLSSLAKDNYKQSVSLFGKKSISNFFAIYRCFFFSIFIIFINTGKTHQIRIHSSIKGFPVIKDNLYCFCPFSSYIFLFLFNIELYFIKNLVYKIIKVFIPPYFLFFFFKKKSNYLFIFYNLKIS